MSLFTTLALWPLSASILKCLGSYFFFFYTWLKTEDGGRCLRSHCETILGQAPWSYVSVCHLPTVLCASNSSSQKRKKKLWHTHTQSFVIVFSRVCVCLIVLWRIIFERIISMFGWCTSVNIPFNITWRVSMHTWIERSFILRFPPSVSSFGSYCRVGSSPLSQQVMLHNKQYLPSIVCPATHSTSSWTFSRGSRYTRIQQHSREFYLHKDPCVHLWSTMFERFAFNWGCSSQ